MIIVQRTTYVAFALHDGQQKFIYIVFYKLLYLGIACDSSSLNEDQQKLKLKYMKAYYRIVEILAGEKFGEFGDLLQTCQSFICQLLVVY